MRLALFLVGAAIGAPVRYVIDIFFRNNFKFPAGILIVNVLGSFILGLVITSETDLTFLLFGFCGALTTWSAFALDLFEQRGRLRSFAVNLLSNYTLGVLAALFGLWVAQ